VVIAVGDASGTSVLGLAAQINITGVEPANDSLVIGTHAGDDVIEGSGLAAGAMQFTADGGDNNDILIGGDNIDVLFGGAGDDVLIGGGGLDVLDGGEGDNVVIQQLVTPAVTASFSVETRQKLEKAEKLKAKFKADH
jgi:Ca2+-binding RTX toxin-like protein